MSSPDKELLLVIREAEETLARVSEESASRKATPQTWSVKEIIGHLIDSATINHGRFVRAQFSDTLIFEGYRQDDWVSTQCYQERPFAELVSLWLKLNYHLSHVFARTPISVRKGERSQHNLHEIAWHLVPPDEGTTLEYFMFDYVEHVRHHLAQIHQQLSTAAK